MPFFYRTWKLRPVHRKRDSSQAPRNVRVPNEESERSVSSIRTSSTQSTSSSPPPSELSAGDTLNRIILLTSDLARHVQRPDAQTVWHSMCKLLDIAIPAVRADSEELLALRTKCTMLEEESKNQKGELNDCYEAIEILESQLEEKDEAVDSMQFGNDELREKVQDLEGMLVAAQIEACKADHEKACSEMALAW
ncbi:hypothetical protein BJ742DRAFT_497967 [Cladochytrium replicatum]|nr:hypothetical protein BJ742DRAFT_497967 [Cladochytrium replicatum]